MRIKLLLLLLLLGGCASVSQSFTYRPANYDGPGWQISAKAEDKVIKDTIAILINGEKVAGGTLHEFKSKDNFYGTYMGRNILAESSLISADGFSYKHECTVFVDNERVATLSF